MFTPIRPRRRRQETPHRSKPRVRPRQPRVRSVQFARVPRKDRLEAFEGLRSHFNDKMNTLNAQLHAGEITVNDWHTDARQAVKRLHVQAWSAGRGGEWDKITFGEWGKVGNRLRRQYGYLRNYADELRTADFEKLSVAKMNMRSGFYGSAARQSFEASLAEDRGLDSSILPAQPGDGTTKCRTNCKCRWSITRRKTGIWIVSWMLGEADHCSTCRRRSRKWKRLKIKNGSFMTEVEPIFD